MGRIKVLAMLLMILTVGIQSILFLGQHSWESYRYRGELGVDIISYSEKWSAKDRLKEVYDELLANAYGEEINYLEAIYLYPDNPHGVAGYYYDSYEKKDDSYILKDGAYIEIFNMDNYDHVAQFARVLSHEYGHHYTTYHLIRGENKTFEEWDETGYASIRGIKDDTRIGAYENKQDKDDHKWDISEIAAEDYVQLFGSELAKKWTDYKDVNERLEENLVHYTYTNTSFNLLPQENLDIPLAADVEGLYSYWFFLGFGKEPSQLPIKSETNVAIIKKRTIINDYNQYHMVWTPIKDVNAYTLVYYPVDNNFFPEPIKMVTNIEKCEAYLGSGIKHLDNGSANVIYTELKGDYILHVFCKDKNGFIHSAEKKKLSF